MKRVCKAVPLFIISVLLAMPGCTQTGKNSEAAAPVVSERQAISSSPSPTLSPSPIPTTPPDITPEQSLSPEPSKTPDDGRITIADGFYYIKLNSQIKKRITGVSYPAKGEKCAITYDDLRYIRLKYYDFEGNVHDDGELIVSAALAKEVTQIFCELYEKKYPFASIRLVDDYGEAHDDNLSMAANNTSAFNYRYMTGTKKLSQHSYGRAIDINPMMNPYIVGDRIAPPDGADYADRTQKLRGMIDHDDLCYKLFIKKGWSWGGDATGDKDYQHFSKKA